ncbi:MAG: hypothetical protein KGZ32_01250 [Dethiobacter sp.]|jgi:hypothetical protein|nr:hypothetical protein [Dethiobacter sp.]
MVDDNKNEDQLNINDSRQTVDGSNPAEAPSYVVPSPLNGAGAASVVETTNNTLGIIGLVAGITGFLMVACCWPLGILLGITALVCGFLAKSRKQRFAGAGIILGIITLITAVIFVIIVINLFGIYSPYFLNELIYQFEYY